MGTTVRADRVQARVPTRDRDRASVGSVLIGGGDRDRAEAAGPGVTLQVDGVDARPVASGPAVVSDTSVTKSGPSNSIRAPATTLLLRRVHGGVGVWGSGVRTGRFWSVQTSGVAGARAGRAGSPPPGACVVAFDGACRRTAPAHRQERCRSNAATW